MDLGARAAPAALVRLVDAGLAACVFIVPLLMGGRHPLGKLVLAGLAAMIAAAWLVHQALRRQPTWRHSPAEILLGLGVLVVLAQLAPLPRPLLGWVSPRLVTLLPLWSGQPATAAGLGTWSCVSLAPAETRSGLVLLLAYAMLFLVTVQRLGRREDVERLLRWIALSAAMLAAFGLGQFVAGNGKFFWVYEHPFTTPPGAVKASFSNRNHFAHFMALGTGPLLWWLYERHRHGSSHSGGHGDGAMARGGLWAGPEILLAVVFFAGLLSLSRGGAVAICLAAAVTVGVYWRIGALRTWSLVGLGGAVLLLVAMLAIHGYDRVSRRLSDLAAGSLDAIDSTQSRRGLWAAVAQGTAEFPILGTGLGTHREVYRLYYDRRHDVEFDHAENGYLQVGMELGVPGLALTLAGMGMLAYWAIAGIRRAKDRRLRMCLGAVLGGLAASAAHSAVDFVWYVPACTAVKAIHAALPFPRRPPWPAPCASPGPCWWRCWARG